MKENSGRCQIIVFEPAENTPEELQNFAEDFFAVTAVNYQDDGKEQLVGYLKTDDTEEKMLVEAAKSNLELPPYKSETLCSDNWLRDNVIEFAPVEVADFLVYGIHEKNISLGDKIGIMVYAATAFGSEHPTTKCCLQALSDLKRIGADVKNTLDVGTGSGILAIAAAKLWPNSKVVAVDIDNESVSVAQQNAADNQVQKQIVCAYSDGYQAETVQNNAPYDIILANILARPLIDMAKDMAQNLSAGGYAVISGFIDNQEDWVIGEHQKSGLRLQKIYCDNNWRAALLRKDI